MRWKNENWMATRFGGHPHLSKGGPVFPTSTTSIHACLYRVHGADLEVGDFATGFTLTAAKAGALLRAIQGTGPTGPCADQREFAVLTVDPGISANVELGGCWRVQRPYPDHGVGSADPTTTGALLLTHG
jgi:hypothetical protein